MRLHGITLGNFKSFSDDVDIPVGRITSLVGPNGAGKSNILDAVGKIAAMLQKGKHIPKPDEFFNDDDEYPIRLGATFELSDGEQLALLKYWIGPVGAVPGEPGPHLPFRLVRYAATLDLGAHLKDEIWMSTANGDLVQFVCASRSGGKLTLATRDIKAAARGAPLPPMRSRVRDGQLLLGDLFTLVDSSLLDRMAGLLGNIKVIGTDRKIPPAVAARESRGISTTGQNLPNELNGLSRRMLDSFDVYMEPVTHGDPLGVEPQAVGSDLALEVRDGCLSRQARHTDLGSGQIQTLILGWQLFTQEGDVILIKEPELHLHAERQKQVARLIKEKSIKDGTQFLVETHSPVFLGTEPGEHVVLVTKKAGRSHATEIVPDNVGLIRRELGITHADALNPTNILFAEGPSDLVAFGPFLKAIAPAHALSTMIYSLDGAYNAKNLGLLMKYLKAEGRQMFVMLDNDDKARHQVEELKGSGLLDKNYRFLEKSLEDEFDSGLVVEAAREMAVEAKCAFSLTAGELDELRGRGGDVAAAVKGRWEDDGCGPFSKVRLAEHMVRLSGGKAPYGIREALLAAVVHFEGGGAAPAGRQGSAGGGP